MGPGANKSVHESFKSRIFISNILMVLLDISPIDLQSQISWGALFYRFNVGLPSVGYKSLAPQEVAPFFVRYLLI